MRLSTEQQRMLADTAAQLPAEKHRAFLERVDALLAQRGGRGRYADEEIVVVGELALASLLAHKLA
jgi:hypothetical protein